MADLVEAYAEALFGLASAADVVDATDEGVKGVVAAIRIHPGLRDVLADEAVPREKKREVLRDVFGPAAEPEVVSIVTLAVERGLAGELGRLAERFAEIAETRRNVAVAEVVTAVPLTEKLRASIAAKLTKSLGRPVTLRERVDESIVGGIVVKVAGRLLDGSVGSQLKRARQTLSTQAGGEA